MSILDRIAKLERLLSRRRRAQGALLVQYLADEPGHCEAMTAAAVARHRARTGEPPRFILALPWNGRDGLPPAIPARQAAERPAAGMETPPD